MSRRDARLAFVLAAVMTMLVGAACWSQWIAERARARAEAQERAEAQARGMVYVPRGSFFMGCDERVDDGCYPDENRGETVQVASFAIDRTEVTVAAYRECVKAGSCSEPDSGGSWGKPGRDEHPVDSVDWDQATAYCRWKGSRLPTDREWEKAARGTDGRTFPWGNQTPTCEQANLSTCGSETRSVGGRTAGASPYGALDMTGNVWEWTADAYGQGRSARGGSWYNQPRGARASGRSRVDPRSRSPLLGFRCAR
jgi:formylglycine-generating enzyme required for sulfatase activity